MPGFFAQKWQAAQEIHQGEDSQPDIRNLCQSLAGYGVIEGWKQSDDGNAAACFNNLTRR
ncbi:hypothetical protein BHF07_11865 [Escherichia coli]|nr:hypothetical protein BHF07_11865 [Escherichia coli]OEN62612.1 hypothetical protein BHF51_14210 [Escherichia coli]